MATATTRAVKARADAMENTMHLAYALEPTNPVAATLEEAQREYAVACSKARERNKQLELRTGSEQHAYPDARIRMQQYQKKRQIY
jgi:hypothetical protein